MANNPITMQQIRMILQQLVKGISQRKIALSLDISRNTVKHYADRFLHSPYSLPQLLELEDELLSELVYGPFAGPGAPGPAKGDRREFFERHVPGFLEDLKRKGVTQRLLWEGYSQQNPDGYGYSQFCERLSRHKQVRGATMHFEHTAAEKMLVDFAGTPLGYVDTTTGEWIKCPVFVCVLPYSGYSYVVALANATIPQVIKALNEALAYFGGVPQSVKCDNMRQMVSKSCRYEPTFTDAISQWSTHYNITLLAARVAKPRDKASVENQVRLTYQRIYAPLRNDTFHSLQALNNAIRVQLDAYHQRLFQQKDYSRSQCFLRYEQPALQPLPSGPFDIKHSVQAKVQKNYHITLGEDWHHYSVPFKFIGHTVQAVYDTDTVEVYHQHRRIALHCRSFKKHGYTTLAEHMPEGHKKYYEQRGWDAAYFLSQASKIGPATSEYMGLALQEKRFTEQTYNACLGMLRLGKAYGNERLENACKRALSGKRYTYRVIHDILVSNLDKQIYADTANNQQIELFRTPTHENIRGKEAYE